MSYSFDMSSEAQLELAGQLRSGTLLPPTITPEMEADLAAVTVEEIAVPTRVGPSRVIKVTPSEGTAPRPCFVNFHGGGFVRPYHRRDTIFCAQLARATGALVLDVDYRLAPEHPFPTGLHECHDVVAWAFDNTMEMGIDPERIAIGGHSAGGNFTASICRMIHESGAFRPCGQVLDYPFLDAATPPEDKVDPRSIMPIERMHAFNVLYCQTPENMTNPLVSPVLSEPEVLEGQPPALMIIAGMDPLRHEAQRYAGQLISAGVDVAVHQFDNCDHGWVVSGKARHDEARALIFGWLNRLYE